MNFLRNDDFGDIAEELLADHNHAQLNKQLYHATGRITLKEEKLC